MSHSIKHPPQLKLYEEQINPWNDDEHSQSMGLDYAPFNPYQFINRHTITFNPESKTKTDDARKKATTTKNSFTDNLRKYEKKKAEQLHLRHQINYIQKNRKELVEQVPLNVAAEHQCNLGVSSLFQQQKTARGHSEQSQNAPELANWSLIMYFDNETNKKRHYHRDIQSFLKFHSKKVESSRQKHGAQPQSYLRAELAKPENDPFQKMLKLKEGIRRRNLKSASSSRQNLEASRQAAEQGVSLTSTIHSEHSSPYKKSYARAIPRTSQSSRESPSRTLEYKVVMNGKTNSIVMGPKQDRSNMRLIHSSQKNRGPSKILNIEGNRVVR